MNENTFWKRLGNSVWTEYFTYDEARVIRDALAFMCDNSITEKSDVAIATPLFNELDILVTR